MRIPHQALGSIRVAVLVLFAALMVTVFGFFWLKAGGKIPLISQPGYRVKVMVNDVDNLVYQSDVAIAGVHIGKVEGIDIQGGDAYLDLRLDDKVAPLHQGATVAVRYKTLIEETYLDITDGAGPALPSGSTLPPSAAKTSVQFDDVLASLDPQTRASLSATLKSTGVATMGIHDDVGRTLEGFGSLGREGRTALTALSAQSDALAQLVGNTATLLDSLDTREGRITQLVRDSDAITQTVSANRSDLEAVMRELPPTLKTLHGATASVTRLANSLSPVANNLAAAGPDLSSALADLPGTSADLRGMLPSLNQTFDRSFNTFDRVGGFSDELRAFFPKLHTNLNDLNPVLNYLKPYGPEVSTFFTGFGQALGGTDPNGKLLRVMPVLNEKTPNQPFNTQFGPLSKFNPYPAPGASRDPSGFQGAYPRIRTESLPPR